MEQSAVNTKRQHARGWPGVALDCFRALWLASQVRLRGKRAAGVLPPVARTKRLSLKEQTQITRTVKALVLCLLFWKPGRCYYRSYALAYVLRKRGVPLILNLGCDNYMEATSRARAHCWLTLGNQLFEENGNPSQRYPYPLGGIKNQVNYWLGSPIKNGK